MSPYCGPGVYEYYAGFDAVGNVSLGTALVATERDCARACCDVDACDAYAFAMGAPLSTLTTNCYFTGGVTAITPNHAFNAGVRTRALS